WFWFRCHVAPSWHEIDVRTLEGRIGRMCELCHTSVTVQKMHRARERSKIDKDIPGSAASRAVNLPHAEREKEARLTRIYPGRQQAVRSICRTRSLPQ